MTNSVYNHLTKVYSGCFNIFESVARKRSIDPVDCGWPTIENVSLMLFSSQCVFSSPLVSQ